MFELGVTLSGSGFIVFQPQATIWSFLSVRHRVELFFSGESSLHFAIVNGDFEMVRLLVENGADVNQRAKGRFFWPEDQKGEYEKILTSGQEYTPKKPTNYAGATGSEQLLFERHLRQCGCRLRVLRRVSTRFRCVLR